MVDERRKNVRYSARLERFTSRKYDDDWIINHDEEEIEVEFIKCMRSAGLSIEAVIEYISLVLKGDITIDARKEILKEQRALLVNRMNEM